MSVTVNRQDMNIVAHILSEIDYSGMYSLFACLVPTPWTKTYLTTFLFKDTYNLSCVLMYSTDIMDSILALTFFLFYFLIDFYFY